MYLIDTNILARYLLNDIPDQSERCVKLFQQASQGEIELFVPVTAFSEITWLLIRQKKMPHEVVTRLLLDIGSMSRVILENEVAVMKALRLSLELNGLSFVDLYHLALADELGITHVYSFDKKMDRYPGVERIEP
ncbi:MAG: PIN domain-containing protein [Thermomicrobiales bacterium]|nr:PIN domain-containing protein [Thermomicrobiales bacterium]